MAKPRILLADDHRIVLEGLRSLLADEFELAGMAANGRELIELAKSTPADAIVADISMPLLNGIEMLLKLRDERIVCPVVFLTMHPDMSYLTRALDAGASAYVLKHSAADELVSAIQTALQGGIYISHQLRTEALAEKLDQTRRIGKAVLEPSGRQREVLQLLAEGKSAKEIGALLDISARTVETHKYKMMDTLGLKTSAELVQYAIRHGLVSG